MNFYSGVVQHICSFLSLEAVEGYTEEMQSTAGWQMVGCGKLHGSPQGFQYHIRACPRSMSNLCCFLSSLTVERARVV